MELPLLAPSPLLSLLPLLALSPWQKVASLSADMQEMVCDQDSSLRRYVAGKVAQWRR
jgi:hypothetical protein